MNFLNGHKVFYNELKESLESKHEEVFVQKEMFGLDHKLSLLCLESQMQLYE